MIMIFKCIEGKEILNNNKYILPRESSLINYIQENIKERCDEIELSKHDDRLVEYIT